MAWVKTELDDETHQTVLEYRDRHGLNMTEAVRQLVEAGVEAEA